MQIHSRITGEQVFATSDGILGRTPEALEATYQRVIEDNTHPAIIAALINVAFTSKSVFYRTRAEILGEHRYLFGTSLRSRVSKVDEPYDALLVVQGSDYNADAYDRVDIARWARADLVANDSSIGPLKFLLDKALFESGKTEPGPKIWGVPVRRLTEVNLIDEGTSYVYGHHKDLQETDRLSVPLELKQRMLEVVRESHQAELDHARN